MDTSLGLEERAAHLVSRMTLGEKVSQKIHGSAAIERLGVPQYNWWNECLPSVARACVCLSRVILPSRTAADSATVEVQDRALRQS